MLGSTCVEQNYFYFNDVYHNINVTLTYIVSVLNLNLNFKSSDKRILFFVYFFLSLILKNLQEYIREAIAKKKIEKKNYHQLLQILPKKVKYRKILVSWMRTFFVENCTH